MIKKKSTMVCQYMKRDGTQCTTNTRADFCYAHKNTPQALTYSDRKSSQVTAREPPPVYEEEIQVKPKSKPQHRRQQSVTYDDQTLEVKPKPQPRRKQQVEYEQQDQQPAEKPVSRRTVVKKPPLTAKKPALTPDEEEEIFQRIQRDLNLEDEDTE